MTLAAWLHTLDPYLVRFSDHFGIAYYGLSYVLGFVIAWIGMTLLARRGLILIPPSRTLDAIVWLALGVIVGGRLGYALVYDPSLFVRFSQSPPWWALLSINKGGMASHGGMVGAALACWRISRGWHDPDAPGGVAGRCPITHALDVVALLTPIGLFFGRIANFINGELLGRIVTPPGTAGPWWTVQFPQELRGWGLDAAGRLVRDPASHAPPLTAEQQTALVRLVESVPIRQVPEHPAVAFDLRLRALIAEADAYRDQLVPLLSSRHPSQLYQALAEGLVLLVIVWAIAARPRRPGVIAAWWLMAYGVFRVLTEVWRLPDPQFIETGRILGLSRGQWLSVGMVIIGAALLAGCLRRAAPPLGGWLGSGARRGA